MLFLLVYYYVFFVSENYNNWILPIKMIFFKYVHTTNKFVISLKCTHIIINSSVNIY